ncbi:MAG: MFS transporter [Bradyrhizobium sp.]
MGAHVLSMLGFATYAALLPDLRDLWKLSNTEAGLIGSAFFGGYIATVSYWTALTDRVDGRRIYAVGSLLAFAGAAGFGFAAEGLWSAALFQALLGAGVAGTYMPGLRLLSDRVAGPLQSRYIAFYTSFFGIGFALSLALAGYLNATRGWQPAFIVSSAGPLLAGMVVFAFVRKSEVQENKRIKFSLATLFPVAAWRKVLANRAAAGYTLGYAVHCVELFGSRGWMVAFLAFSAGLQAPGAGFPWNLAAIAAVVNLVAVPSSILGNEAALRMGRGRWILIAMAASGATGILLSLIAPLHWAIVLALLVAHALLVMADSGTLTAGLVGTVAPELRGAALGMYSLAGFAGGMVGPPLFGFALDVAGGQASAAAWVWAYVAIGAGGLAAPLVARTLGRARASR